MPDGVISAHKEEEELLKAAAVKSGNVFFSPNCLRKRQQPHLCRFTPAKPESACLFVCGGIGRRSSLISKLSMEVVHTGCYFVAAVFLITRFFYLSTFEEFCFMLQ